MKPLKVLSQKLREPLSETTRKARKNLLALSVIGIAINRGGLIPKEISSLGIIFEQHNQDSLILLLAVIISYHLSAFIIYSFSESQAWKLDEIHEIIEKAISYTKRESVISSSLLDQQFPLTIKYVRLDR